MPQNQNKTIELDSPPDQAETPQLSPEEQKLMVRRSAPQTPASNNKSVLKPMEPKESKSKNAKKNMATIIAALVIVVAGITTGYGMSKAFSPKGYSAPTKTAQEVSEKGLEVGDIVGSQDESTFKDHAEGVLVAGGVEGEGSHHLLRPGGKSQNVYLTSSVLDLDELVDHKVKVWGETFAAQKAGWLMDVGRAQVIEMNAEKPFEEEVE